MNRPAISMPIDWEAAEMMDPMIQIAQPI